MGLLFTVTLTNPVDVILLSTETQSTVQRQLQTTLILVLPTGSTINAGATWRIFSSASLMIQRWKRTNFMMTLSALLAMAAM